MVLFHLDVPGFHGGYVGVDMFFVISGFLITGILRDRTLNRRFSFSEFYASRVIRLLPAVIATVFATSIASLWILQPQMLGPFTKSAAASVFSLANFVFYGESGYWEANSELKPLLHMWSLGVEEQFYLFWPALVVLAVTYLNRYYVALLTLVSALSFAVSLVAIDRDPAAAFYLLPFRVWQFGLGALALELARHRWVFSRWRSYVRWLGLLFCALAIGLYDGSTLFPGVAALLPSIGTALTLIAADKKRPDMVLGSGPALWLGRVSYSLYLAHWPPIALFRVWTLEDPGHLAKLWLGAVILILTLLLHYQVERRFYRRGYVKKLVRPWRGVPMTSMATSLILATALLVVAHNPQPIAQRQFSLSAAEIDAYSSGRKKHSRQACKVAALKNAERCSQPLRSPILFLGNSHELDAFNILRSALVDRDAGELVLFGGNDRCGELKTVDGWAQSPRKTCQRRLDALRDSLGNVSWHAVVVGARFAFGPQQEPFVTIVETMKERFPDLVVVVFGDYIVTREHCGILINQYGSALACRDPAHVSYFAGDPNVWRKSGDRRWTHFERLSPITDGFLDKVELLCDSRLLEDCPVATPNGHPMFVDAHHLTHEFATWVGERLADENPEWLKMLYLDD